jgi:hypothetical protein
MQTIPEHSDVRIFMGPEVQMHPKKTSVISWLGKNYLAVIIAVFTVVFIAGIAVVIIIA